MADGHVELPQGVFFYRLRVIHQRRNALLQRGFEGGGAGGNDVERRYVEINQDRIDGVHAGSRHHAQEQRHQACREARLDLAFSWPTSSMADHSTVASVRPTAEMRPPAPTEAGPLRS